MKSFFTIFLIATVFYACSSGDAKPAVQPGETKQLTTIQWIDSVRDLGKINEGQKLNVSFRFKNTGEKPLIIESVHPGCGCTVADYPKQPIKPGEEGEITGSFNSEGREGLQHKEITVLANTPGNGSHRIAFDVEVIKVKSN